MIYEEYMPRLMKLIAGCGIVIISGCTHVPDIISVGDCEHGIVYSKNVNDVKKIFPDAQIADVLIAGGCYQEHFIKENSK